MNSFSLGWKMPAEQDSCWFGTFTEGKQGNEDGELDKMIEGQNDLTILNAKAREAETLMI